MHVKGYLRLGLTMSALALVVFVVAACGSSGGSSSSTASSSSGTSSGNGASSDTSSDNEASSGNAFLAKAEKAVEEAEAISTKIATANLGPFTPKSSGTIYAVTCELAIEGCTNTLNGIRAATKVLGYKLEVCSATGSNPESGPECLESALNAKPDAIIDLGLNQAAEPWFPKAKAAGIPVTGIYSGNAKTGANVQVAGGLFGVHQAETMGDFLVASTEGKAHAVVTWAAGYTIVIEKKEGIEKVLSECEECSSTPLEFDPTTVQQTFPQQVTSALQANPEINAVVGTFSTPATFAVPPARELGREGLHVVGFDGTAPNLELLRNEEIYTADAANSGMEPGWIAVEASARMMIGEKVPAVLPVDSILFTKKNIGSLPNGFPGATGYEQQFKELWGKG